MRLRFSQVELVRLIAASKEQARNMPFNPAAIVPEIGFSPDKMLLNWVSRWIK
jgi:hypothetical protein